MRESIQKIVLRELALQAGAEQSSEYLFEKIRRFILRIHNGHFLLFEINGRDGPQIPVEDLPLVIIDLLNHSFHDPLQMFEWWRNGMVLCCIR